MRNKNLRKYKNIDFNKNLRKYKSIVLNKIWVSYGSETFEPIKFKSIVIDMSCRCLNKPYGGLWASPADSKYGWKDWCEMEDFRTDRLSVSFEFKLSVESKIYVIDNMADLECISTAGPNEMGRYYINYELLLDMGYDGLFVTSYAARAFHLYTNDDLINDLNAWDCESICIFNKDVVIPINKA